MLTPAVTPTLTEPQLEEVAYSAHGCAKRGTTPWNLGPSTFTKHAPITLDQGPCLSVKAPGVIVGESEGRRPKEHSFIFGIADRFIAKGSAGVLNSMRACCELLSFYFDRPAATSMNARFNATARSMPFVISPSLPAYRTRCCRTCFISSSRSALSASSNRDANVSK